MKLLNKQYSYIHKLYFSGQSLPNEIEEGSRMSQTRDEKGLIMTYEKGVYFFHCDSATQCYWKKKKFTLKINRVRHIMLTVPSTLVEKCKEV